MTQHFNKTSEKEKRRRDQTFCEKIMWTYLRDRKTLGYKFRRQYSVDHYVIDFYCPELKLQLKEMEAFTMNLIKKIMKNIPIYNSFSIYF